MFRCLSVAGLCLASAIAVSQGIKPYDKIAERKAFHPTLIKGSSAADREISYRKRVQLETDSVFGGVKWRNIGPESQGGRVLGIKAAESDPNKIFVAFATGGFYSTTDDGQTWESLFANQSVFGIGDFDISKDGKTILLGSGEANNQRTSYSGNGMYKSMDGGATWRNVGLPESHHISRVVIDPKNQRNVWVCVTGHLYSQNPERGVYKSVDGGETWLHVLKKDEFTGAIDMAMSPKDTNVVVASMYDRDRRAWNFRESGPGSQVYRTENGGTSWVPVLGLPSGDSAGRIGLAWSESNASRVYAFVDNQGMKGDWLEEDEKAQSGRLTARRFYQITESMFSEIDRKVLTDFWKSSGPTDLKIEDAIEQVKAGKLTMSAIRTKMVERNANIFEPGQGGDEVWRSDDAGKTFRKMQGFGTVGGYYFERIFVNPKNADDVWACALPLLRSLDGGQTWTNATTGRVHVDHHAVHFDAKNPKKIWVGNDGGLYLTRNDGKQWTHFENLSVGQSTTVAVDNKIPYNVYTGMQDNGTSKGPNTYLPGISNPSAWTSVGGGDGSAIAVDPREDNDLIFVASQFGSHSAFEQKNNRRYNASPAPARGEASRANWVSPIVISSHHNDIVYVGYNRLYRSFDRGRTYKPISPDLTKSRPNGDVPHSSLKDISESPLRFGLIYCGADDGRMTMTQDGGFTWNEIPTPAPEKWISRVVASRYAEGTVYVAQNGYRDDDWSSILWKSTDFGKTWSSIVGNLPNESINVIREDPKKPETLYIGTDMGVFVTFDGGKNWESLNAGLGRLPVHDMVIQEREYDLVIGTHAQGCWVLPLKQVAAVTPEMRAADLTLLSLSDGIKLSSWGYERRSDYEPGFAKPPTVKISVFAKTAGQTTIQLADRKTGKVIVESTQKLIRGHNELELSLRLTDPKKVVTKPANPKSVSDILKDPFDANRARFVDAGDYKIIIKSGGKSVEKDWTLS